MTDTLPEQLRLNACRLAHESEDQFKQRRIRVELEAAAEIERLREAAKGSTILVNQASATIKRQEAKIERLTRERYTLIADLADMKARALAAESSLSEAVKAAYEDAARIAEDEDVLTHDPFKHASAIASAIRARAAKKD
jgi:hypothetical protein